MTRHRKGGFFVQEYRVVRLIFKHVYGSIFGLTILPTVRRWEMQLTDEILSRYVGGQIEIQNRNEGYLYRGEIATIAVEGEGDDATLRVTLKWMAKGEGFPSGPKRWVKDDDLTYGASLMIYSVSDIGDGRIALNSWIVGETTVLFPLGGSKLDSSKVEGLNLEDASS